MKRKLKKRVKKLKARLKVCKKKKVVLKKKLRGARQEIEIISDLVQPTCGTLDVRLYQWHNNRKKGHINTGWTVEAYIRYKPKMLGGLGLNGIESPIVRTQITRSNPLKLILDMQMLAERLNLKIPSIRYFVNFPRRGPIEMKVPKDDKL